MKNYRKIDKKGISTILAAILLIIIVLVIAGLFFMFSRTMFTSLSATYDFEIVDARLITDPSGATLQVTVKNIGNSRIVISSVSIGGWSSAWNQALDPGQVTGKSFSPTGSFTIGQKVTLKVTAQYDSTPLEKIVQVVVQG